MDYSKHTLVGIVVCFSPTRDQLDNICRIASELDHVFMADNTEVSLPDMKHNSSLSNITLLRNCNIGGIAGALNLATRSAISQFGECCIFLLDQDSLLPKYFFKKQYSFAVTNNRKIVAPKYYDINSKTFGNYTKLSKWTVNNIKGISVFRPFETTFAITSGTLIFSSLFSEIGYFREDYFIDHVDSEFCIRLQKHGYSILINPDVVFDHSIGNRKLKNFIGINFKPNYHPANRRYYAVRNGIFMVKQYFRLFPSISLLIIMRICYEYAGIIFFENSRISKIKALIFGVIDGIFNKGGRCNRSF